MQFIASIDQNGTASYLNALTASYAMSASWAPSNSQTTTWYSSSFPSGGSTFTMSFAQPITEANAYFQCITADGAYSVGDIVTLESLNTAGILWQSQTEEGGATGPTAYTFCFSFNTSSITLYSWTGGYSNTLRMHPKIGSSGTFPYFQPNTSNWQLLIKTSS